MAGNGGIIGPTKVVNTPSTRTESFTSSGTFQKTNCTSTIPEVLVVAGGGGGGTGGRSGGGGAGGYRTATCLSIPNGCLTVTVGAGGAAKTGNPNPGADGNPGSNSTFSSITSAGGGGGAGAPFSCTGNVGLPGGSGGGGGQSGAPAVSGPKAGGSGNTPPTSPSLSKNSISAS